MIDVKIEEKEKVESKAIYPCLKKRTQGAHDQALIVLFNKPKCGTVMAVGYSGYPIGEHVDSWYEENFEPFVGKITLSTEL